MTYVDITENCWIWKGGVNSDGYGMFGFDGTMKCAHRISMHFHRGFNLESKDFILHKNECHNRRCVNPEHLYVGNNNDNMKDVKSAGNHYNNIKTHCAKGHEFTEANTRYCEGRSGTFRVCKICSKAAVSKYRERLHK